MTGYRDALPDPEPPEKGPYKQLVPYARLRQIPYAGAVSLSVEAHQRTIVISLSINSGNVMGYDVSVPIAETPEILVRPETATDREGKDRGINREAQVGDPEFDQRVYIETEANDQAVVRVLSPEVRAAVLRVLEQGITSITLGGGTAQFSVSISDQHDVFEPARVEAMIAATRGLEQVAAVSLHAIVPNTGGSGTVGLSVLFAVVAIPWMIVALSAWPLSSVGLPFLAVPGGWFAWAASRKTFARATAGHSRSFRRYLTSLTFTFFAFPAAAIAIACTINGAFDRRPERVRTGTIFDVRSTDHGPSIRVRWDDGSVTSTTDFSGVPREDLRVTGRFHAGALGAEWREIPLEVRFFAPNAKVEP